MYKNFRQFTELNILQITDLMTIFVPNNIYKLIFITLMKKLLLSSMMLVAGIFAASAAEATIDYSAQGFSNQQSVDGTAYAIGESGINVTIAKGTGKTAPAYYTSGTSVRMYAGNTMTFTVPSGTTVTGISMTLRDYSYNTADDDSGYTVSAGTFTCDPKTNYTASWTGSVDGTDLVITLNNAANSAGKYPQLGVRTITVTYSAGAETKCATPKFTKKSGTFYEPVSVEMTCSTEGATIAYTITKDGAEYTKGIYSEAISLSEAGSYEVSAVALKDGLGNSDIATATYVIANPVEVSSISEFIMMGESDATPVYKWTFPVTVAAQMKGDGYGSTYVKDANGDFMYIYGKDVPAYNVGDVIPAGVQGEYQNYNGLYEMTYPDGETFAPATVNEGFTPAEVSASAVTADEVNHVVLLKGVTYSETTSGSSTTYAVADETGSVTVRYQSKWGVANATNGEKYDLLCAVAVYKDAIQVYPIEFKANGSVDALAADTAVRALEGAVEVNANGQVMVINAAGQVVANQTVNGQATIALAKGFYIVNAAGTVAKVIVK